MILLGINILCDNLYVIFITTLIFLFLNFKYKIDVKKNMGKIKFLFFLYFMTCLLQIFYTQEGRVIFKIYKFYITEEGMRNFTLNFLRIYNLMLLSWIVTTKKLLNGKFNKYQTVIENVIDLVPQALVMVRKRMKIKWFFRYILEQIKVKN
nr:MULTISPECIES: CbiQ family ECF transporter T component [unclassified Fusobacterium]